MKLPIKDKTKAKESAKRRQQKHRAEQNATLNVSHPDSETVTPWHKLKDYLSQSCPGMSRLERTQRICGSLNKYSRDVFLFGVGLTAAEIGDVIGVQPGLFERE